MKRGKKSTDKDKKLLTSSQLLRKLQKKHLCTLECKCAGKWEGFAEHYTSNTVTALTWWDQVSRTSFQTLKHIHVEIYYTIHEYDQDKQEPQKNQVHIAKQCVIWVLCAIPVHRCTNSTRPQGGAPESENTQWMPLSAVFISSQISCRYQYLQLPGIINIPATNHWSFSSLPGNLEVNSLKNKQPHSHVSTFSR